MTENSFKKNQLKHERVKLAYHEKGLTIKSWLAIKNIKSPHLFLRAFKEEEILEVWAKSKGEKKFLKIKEYEFCSSSGELGPKRKQGDFQIPEGFYSINRFNPESNYHLSLGIDYPNSSDRILGHGPRLGGDIFIHGACATVGCIPITDDKIKELYILAVEAKNNGQLNIPVHIFPTRLTAIDMKYLKRKYSHNQDLIKFWENLKEGYDRFETSKELSTFTISERGKYQFQ